MSVALDSVARALLFALGSGIVDAAALALLTWTAIALLRPSAKARHALWWIALAAASVVPFASIGGSLGHLQVTRTPAADAPSKPAAPTTIVAPLGPFEGAGDRESGNAYVVAGPAVSSVRAAEVAALPTPAFFGSPVFAKTAIALWLFVAALGMLKLICDMVTLRNIKRRARPLDGSILAMLRLWREGSRGGRRAEIRVSDDVDIPAAAGFGDAAILLPSRVVDRESAADLDQIALHEYAHLARYDDVTNLAERIVSAFYWFNPAIGYTLRRIAFEREIACDDWVIARTGRAHRYASCLLRLAQSTHFERGTVPALGAFRNATQVAARIERLLERRPNTRPFGRFVTAALIVVAAIIIAAQAMRAPAIAIEVPATVAASNDGSPERIEVRVKGDGTGIDRHQVTIVRKVGHVTATVGAEPVSPKQRVIRDHTQTVEIIVLPKGAHVSPLAKVRTLDALPPLPALPQAAPSAPPAAGVPQVAPLPPAPPVPPSAGIPQAWSAWSAGGHAKAFAIAEPPEAIAITAPSVENDGAVDAAGDELSQASDDYAQAVEENAEQGHSTERDAKVRAARERLRAAKKRFNDTICRHLGHGRHAYAIDADAMASASRAAAQAANALNDPEVRRALEQARQSVRSIDSVEMQRAFENTHEAVRVIDSAEMRRAMQQLRESMRQAAEAMRSVRSTDMQRAIERARAEVERERAETSFPAPPTAPKTASP